MPKVLVDVPEALDELARERGEPVEELARQALAEWLREMQEDAEDARIASERWDALQHGETAERDWDEFVKERPELYEDLPEQIAYP